MSLVLSEFLTDIANAIRSKKGSGTAGDLNAQEFADEIMNLPSTGYANVEVIQNPDDSVDLIIT